MAVGCGCVVCQVCNLSRCVVWCGGVVVWCGCVGDGLL